MPKPRSAKSALRGYWVLILFSSGFGGRGWRAEEGEAETASQPECGQLRCPLTVKGSGEEKEVAVGDFFPMGRLSRFLG